MNEISEEERKRILEEERKRNEQDAKDEIARIVRDRKGKQK